MKKKVNKKNPKTGVITVTQEDYRQQKARGLSDDEIMKPGKYKFRRGSFTDLHGGDPEQLREAMKPHNIKVGVYIKLDLDILNFFKARAEQPGGMPYQTQINAELRKVMEGGQSDSVDIDKLIHNETFIAAIAARVKELARKTG